MVLRHVVERIDDRRREPSERAPPRVRALPRRLVGPYHRLRLVPSVAVEPRLRVVCMARHDCELVRDVIEGRVLRVAFEEARCVARVERTAHVESVEPHLVRVHLLVPEAAFGHARLDRELRELRVDDLPQPLASAKIVHVEGELARVDAVELAVLHSVAEDFAVLSHHAVDVVLRPCEGFFAQFRTPLRDRERGLEFESVRVLPLRLLALVDSARNRIALHLALQHPCGSR